MPRQSGGFISNPGISSLLACLAGLLLYTATMLPGLEWDGGAEAQLRAYLGAADSAPGGSPPYSWAGWALARLLPADPAWSINLASVLYSAAILGLFMATGRELLLLVEGETAERGSILWTTVLSTAGLALHPVFWYCATRPRPVVLATLSLSAAAYQTVRFLRSPTPGNLFGAGLFLGLGFSAEIRWLVLLPLFVAVVAVKARPATRWIAGAAGVAVGLGPYATALVRDVARLDPPALLALLFLDFPDAGAQRQVGSGGSPAWPALWLLAGFFPWGAAAALHGARRLGRASRRLFFLFSAGVVFLLYVSPGGPDPSAAHGASLAAAFLTLPGWSAWVRLRPGLRRWTLAIVLLAPLVYAFADVPRGQRGVGPQGVPFPRPIAAGDRSARDEGVRVLDSLPAGATLEAAPGAAAPLRFLQIVEERRTDVTIAERLPARQWLWTHPAAPALYLMQPPGRLEPGLELRPVEPENGLTGARLWSVSRLGPRPPASPFPADDSYWEGWMSPPATLKLQALRLNDTWLIRMRLGYPWIYPKETRVDNLSIRGDEIRFTCSGFAFRGLLVDDAMTGEWEVTSLPQYKGTWEVRRK